MKKYNALLINGLLDKTNHQNAVGEQIHFNGELFYKISNVANMRPFFMSIVSSNDHWLFLSSNGGISAGRSNSNNALFPYVTDDKITDNIENTGSKSIFIVHKGSKKFLWEPFSPRHDGIYDCENNLYKIFKATKLFLRRSIMILKYHLAMSGQHQKSLDLLEQLDLKT